MPETHHPQDGQPIYTDYMRLQDASRLDHQPPDAAAKLYEGALMALDGYRTGQADEVVLAKGPDDPTFASGRDQLYDLGLYIDTPGEERVVPTEWGDELYRIWRTSEGTVEEAHYFHDGQKLAKITIRRPQNRA